MHERAKPTPIPINEVIYGCPTGKIGYPSKSSAKRSLKRQKREGKLTRSVYQCPRCPHWHATKCI